MPAPHHTYQTLPASPPTYPMDRLEIFEPITGDYILSDVRYSEILTRIQFLEQTLNTRIKTLEEEIRVLKVPQIDIDDLLWFS